MTITKLEARGHIQRTPVLRGAPAPVTASGKKPNAGGVR